jgi:hypothetical protein
MNDPTRFYDAFGDRRPGLTSYRFVCPGVALSGADVAVEFRDGQWHATQTEGDLTWTAAADDKVAVVLALIARRYGLQATFTPDGP